MEKMPMHPSSLVDLSQRVNIDIKEQPQTLNCAVKLEPLAMDASLEAKSRPLSTLSVFSFIPPRRTETPEMRYFNTTPKASETSLYDCIHHSTEGYDIKLHRDDRTHAKARGLDIFSEESSRPVPVLSSSVYGRFTPPQHDTGKTFARIAHIRSELYRKNGIIWTVEEGYGCVTPV